MNDFNRNLVLSLINAKKNVNKSLDKWLESAVNEILNNDLTEFLHYEPYARKGYHSGDSRNGYYPRTLKTLVGTLHFEILRDRTNQFHQHVIPAHKQNNGQLVSFIVGMYKDGATTREITKMVDWRFGSYYSPQAVSNLAKRITKEVQAFKNQRLSSHYGVIYLDGTYVLLRRGTVSKEAVYVAIGIKTNGNKEVLSFTIEPTESENRWRAFLNDLRSRGVKSVLLFVTDGLLGMPRAISGCSPRSKYQQCLVHVRRDLTHQVRTSDRRSVYDDFTELYYAHDLKDGKRILTKFMDKWGLYYPRMARSLRNRHHLLTFLEFPRQIRQSIYSTNIIENFNGILKRDISKHVQFPNESSLARYIISPVLDYNYRFGHRSHRGFKQVTDTLDSMF